MCAGGWSLLAQLSPARQVTRPGQHLQLPDTTSTQRLYTRHCHVLSMGNQLSTWNLTIQSAVRGPSFDEFPAYNQERIFSDYTWFYIGIGCTAGVALLLILFNFVLGCIYK